MAIKKQNDIINNLSPQVDYSVPTPSEGLKPEHSLSETWGAAFKSENLIGSAIEKYKQTGSLFSSALSDSFQPDYDPFKDIQGYEDSADAFTYANSDDEVEQIKGFIDSQRRSRQILAESGISGMAASMVAGTLDPTILIPGGATIKVGKFIARAGKSAAAGAALTGAAVGVQEIGLHATQTERTAQESAMAVGAGMFLGGVLGGAAGGLAKEAREVAESTIKAELMDDPVKLQVNEDKSIGAAQSTTLSDFELDRVNKKLVKAMSGLGIRGLQSPSIRALTGEFGTTASVADAFFDHGILLKKHAKGLASNPVEIAMRQDHAVAVKMNKDLQDLYRKHNKTSEQKLGFYKFNEEVGKAMRRGDTHAIPEVQAAAQRLRKDMDAVTKDLQKRGILPEDLEVKTATSYFQRKYNKKKIEAERPQFEDIAYRDLLQKKAAGDPRLIDADEAEMRGIAEEITDNILGLGDDQIPIAGLGMNLRSGTKFTKERVWDIQDAEIEDYLESNASQIVGSYILQGRALSHMHDKLQEFGAESVNDLLRQLKSEFTDKLQKVKDDPKASKKLNKAYRDEQKLITSMYDVVMGTYTKQGGADTALRYLRKYQVVNKLGGVVISSLPDAMMPVFRHGVLRTLTDGWLPVLRSFSKSKESADQLKEFAVGIELETSNLLKSMTDPDATIGRIASRTEQAADLVTETFGKATGLTYWNNFGKRTAGRMSAARTIRQLKAFEKTGKLSDKEVRRLSSIGIGSHMYKRILDQYKKYGETSSGSYISNFEKWSDQGAKEAFGSSILKDVDSTILTPSKGDIPLWGQGSELGRTVFQFKSFAAAAHNKLLISGIQRRDADVAAGTLGLVFLGAMTYVIKEKLKGREPDISMDTLLEEGLSRGGVLGLYGDVAFAAMFPYSSRYAARSTYGTLVGPSSGTIEEFLGVPYALADGEITDSERKKMIRLLPYQNLFYLRKTLEAAFGDNNDRK